MWLGIAATVIAPGLIIWGYIEHGSVLWNPVGALGIGLTFLISAIFKKAITEKEKTENKEGGKTIVD